MLRGAILVLMMTFSGMVQAVVITNFGELEFYRSYIDGELVGPAAFNHDYLFTVHDRAEYFKVEVNTFGSQIRRGNAFASSTTGLYADLIPKCLAAFRTNPTSTRQLNRAIHPAI